MTRNQSLAYPRSRRTHRAAILPLVAVTLPLFLLMAAFAINVAYMELSRTELQVAADAAARAGGRTYANTGDMNLAKAVARNAASRNHVAGQALQLADADFEFGVATRPSPSSRYIFQPTAAGFNSLRLTARRTPGSLDGPIRMLLPNVFGVNDFASSAQATSTQVELDIALVVDRSGSMAYADNENSNTFANPAAAPRRWNFGDAVPSPSRWIDARNAVSAFLNVLDQTPQSEQVSLVTYGDNARVDVGLTTDYLTLLNGMDVYTRSFPEGMTNIGGGIDRALTSLSTGSSRSWASKVIVVLTDGIHNTGTNPNSAARRAKNQGATVYTVTFSNEANQRRMRRVADIADGSHHHARFGAQLVIAFQEIAKSLPTLIVE